MAFRSKILVTILVVCGFDAVASALSRIFQFEYTKLAWAPFLIYLALGYWGAQRRGVVHGALLGAIAGLFESTIGWFISRKIGPFIELTLPALTPGVVVIVVITNTALGSVFGLVGASLCKAFGQSRAVSTS
jgi:hypothetical protein